MKNIFLRPIGTVRNLGTVREWSGCIAAGLLIAAIVLMLALAIF